jgi:hypothetical protein
MVCREEQAAGGFPFRESALMREGLTGGKVQSEAGGAFIPSNLARAYSLSLQKGIAGNAFLGMIPVARPAAAAERRVVVVVVVTVTAEPRAAEPEAAAEDEGATAAAERPETAAGEATATAAAAEAEGAGCLCNFVARRRMRAAPQSRSAMVEEELVDVPWRAQAVFQKNGGNVIGLRRAGRRKTVLSIVVSTGFSRTIALWSEEEKRRKKREWNGAGFCLRWTLRAHVCANISKCLSILSTLARDQC